MLERRDHAGATVIGCEEARLDAMIAVQFKNRFRTLAGDTENRVILDLSRVEFLDSSGLGALVAVYKFLAPERSLDLAGLTPAVERVLKLTRMDSVFGLYKDAEAALAGPGGDDVSPTAA